MNTKKKRVFSMAVYICFSFLYCKRRKSLLYRRRLSDLCQYSSSRADIKECREWYDYDCNHKSDADIVCTIDNRSVFNCF